MIKQRVLFISGILVAIMYFLGFPNFWRMIFLLILGALISTCAVLNYYERRYLDQKIKNLESKTSNSSNPSEILIEEYIIQDNNETA